MDTKATASISRPADVVFEFIGTNHVLNHPRWDHQMHLDQVTEGPLRVGTAVRRTHTRAGAPVSGSMTCTEFDPPRAVAWDIQDGPVKIHGRRSIEPDGPDRCLLTIYVNIPGVPNRLDPMPLQRSADRIKELVEAEF